MGHTPGPAAIERLVAGLDHRIRVAVLAVVGGLLVGAAGLVVLSSSSLRAAAPFVVGPTVACIYATTIFRYSRAKVAVRRDEPRSVWVHGWCRPDDGCNYAVFDAEPETPTADPEYVVRLPLRREMTTGPAWTSTSGRGAAVVFDGDGELLGAGRVLEARHGREIYRRRGAEPDSWMRPPDGFTPPGG